jgi:hypothetical protein
MTIKQAGPLVAVVALVACYHATIETGLQPSTQTIEKSFASGWIYGLVPPSTVSTTSRCPSGVARVETQLSFVNQLVNFLTLGIYTPMSIKVTCAATGHAQATPSAPTVGVRADASTLVVQAVFAAAAAQATSTGAPVFVHFIAPPQLEERH